MTAADLGGVAAPTRGRTVRRRAGAHFPYAAVSLATGALLWELVGRAADVPFFPPLSVVVVRLGEMISSGLILGSLSTSLANLAIGFGVSLVLGLGVGTLMGRYRTLEAALSPYVYALLTAPSLVFAPIFFSLLGAGRESIIAIVVMYSTFIMMITTMSAIHQVDSALVEMGRSYGASGVRLLWLVMLPAATPSIMAGIRLGVGRAVTGMINGEMFISVVGLGRVVTQAGSRFDGASVLAVLIVIIFVALVAVALVQAVDRKLTSWVPRTARGRA